MNKKQESNNKFDTIIIINLLRNRSYSYIKYNVMYNGVLENDFALKET